jgi:hypothetical protein
MPCGCFIDFGELREPPPGGGCPPNDGAAEWRFDEGQGQTAANSLSDCYAVTLGSNEAPEPGDPAWTNDTARACSGAALSFDGILEDPATDRAFANVLPAHSFTFDFCVFAETTQMEVYPRIVSTEEAVSDSFYVNVSIYSPTDATLETWMGGTSQFAKSEVESGIFALGERSCWRIAYDDQGDRLLHIFEAVGSSYTEVPAYVTQQELAGDVHLNARPMVFGNRAAGAPPQPLFGVIDEVRLSAGTSNAPPPSCAP